MSHFFHLNGLEKEKNLLEIFEINNIETHFFSFYLPEKINSWILLRGILGKKFIIISQFDH